SRLRWPYRSPPAVFSDRRRMYGERLLATDEPRVPLRRDVRTPGGAESEDDRRPCRYRAGPVQVEGELRVRAELTARPSRHDPLSRGRSDVLAVHVRHHDPDE